MPTHAELTHSVVSEAVRSGVNDGLRLAYLLSRYPAISHTFFLNEVLGLRELGIEINTASVNLPDRPLEALPPLEAEEARTTYYLKAGSKLRLALCVLGAVAKHPGVFLRGLRAAARIPSLSLRKRAVWLAYLGEAMLLGEWMRQQQLAHLHVHFGGPVASVGLLTSAAWQIPYSLTIHGPEELQDFSHFQMSEKLIAASFVLCISDFARSQIMQRLPAEQWPKVKVVRLGVTESLLSDFSQATIKGATPLHIVCVGRLVPEKGQRLLLEAIRTLRERGVELRLTLVGGGPEQSMLERVTEAHGLGSVVHFAGSCSHEKTKDIVRTADVFVLPSFAEGIPVALMEAMSYEVACISTTIAGISELIRHGEDGLLVPPGNTEALTESLALLLESKELRDRLGKAGRQHVLKEYRLRDNHAKLADIFRVRLAEEVAAR